MNISGLDRIVELSHRLVPGEEEFKQRIWNNAPLMRRVGMVREPGQEG